MSENNIICPGCHLHLPYQQLAPAERYNASGECLDLFNELSVRTFALQHPDFHHQLSVDAYGAQHSGGVTKNITTAYALIGLCLALEHGFTGRQVQHVHTIYPKQHWEKLSTPEQTGAITVQDVLKETSPEALYAGIEKWAASVWSCWIEHHEWVREKTVPYL